MAEERIKRKQKMLINVKLDTFSLPGVFLL